MRLDVENGLIAGFVSGDFFGPWTQDEAIDIVVRLLDACLRVQPISNESSARVQAALDALCGPQND